MHHSKYSSRLFRSRTATRNMSSIPPGIALYPRTPPPVQSREQAPPAPSQHWCRTTTPRNTTETWPHPFVRRSLQIRESPKVRSLYATGCSPASFRIRPVTRKVTRFIPSSSTTNPTIRVKMPAFSGSLAATVMLRPSPGGIVTGRPPVIEHVQSFAPAISRMGWSSRLNTSTDASRVSPGAPVPTSTSRGEREIVSPRK